MNRKLKVVKTRLSQMFYKTVAAVTAGAMFVNQSMTVTADGSSSASALTAAQTNTAVDKFTLFGQGVIISISAVCLIALVAVPQITGGEEGHQKAMKNFKNIVIGIGIGELAFLIAKFGINAFTGV